MVSWKIVKPRLVRITFIWGLMLFLAVFYLQKLWNFNFSRNIMQTEYMAPNCRVSFIWMQSLSDVFLLNMIKKSVSRLFIVILLHCVVEYSLNQFPCHRHVCLWKPWINKLVTRGVFHLQKNFGKFLLGVLGISVWEESVPFVTSPIPLQARLFTEKPDALVNCSAVFSNASLFVAFPVIIDMCGYEKSDTCMFPSF